MRILRRAKDVAEGLLDCEHAIQAAMCDPQRHDWDKYFTLKNTATAFTSMNNFGDDERVPLSLTNETWGIRSLGKMTKIMGAMHGMDRAKWGVLQSNADRIKALLKAANNLADALMDIDLPELPEEEVAPEAAYF
jgi:hypothetical protein